MADSTEYMYLLIRRFAMQCSLSVFADSVVLNSLISQHSTRGKFWPLLLQTSPWMLRRRLPRHYWQAGSAARGLAPLLGERERDDNPEWRLRKIASAQEEYFAGGVSGGLVLGGGFKSASQNIKRSFTSGISALDGAPTWRWANVLALIGKSCKYV